MEMQARPFLIASRFEWDYHTLCRLSQVGTLPVMDDDRIQKSQLSKNFTQEWS
jgi:hypothetical protein